MKIAILLSRFPFPLERGDKLRAYYQIKYLSAFHEIYLFAINDGKIKNEWLEELKPFCKEIVVENTSFLSKIIGVGYALFYGWPLQTGIVYKHSLKKKIENYISLYNIDLIYCQLIRMVPYCISLSSPKVLDYMDAFGEGMRLRAKLVPFPESAIYTFESNRVLRYEQIILSKFSFATIISENDKMALNVEGADIVKMISNGIDTEKFKPNFENEKKYDVGFIGNLGYLPNIEAAEYLVNVVTKAYKNKYHRDLKVLISGARPDERVNALKSTNIHIHGWIENIAEAYQSIVVMCAPIFSGTGQQNKILEAMACGTPVLCNAALNRSIGAVNGQSIVAIDNLDEMLDALYDLLSNVELQKNISESARVFVVQNYTWSMVTQNLNNYFENALSNKVH